MARLAGKVRGDMRAMEEQMERHNPVNPKAEMRTGVYGRGATPSMGLSQFRGGNHGDGSGSESDEQMEGGGLLSSLLPGPLGSVAGLFGLGHDDMTRMVGSGTRKGQRRKTARRAYEGMGTGAGMSEATQMGLHLGKHLHTLHGAGFWSDFGNGFMSVIRPVAGIAKSVAPLLGPEGMAASGVMNAIGLGHGRRGARGRPRKGGASNSDTGAYEGQGRERDDRMMTGLGTGAGMLGQNGHGIRQGGGFLSDLGIPIISNLAGAIGLGKKRRGRKGGQCCSMCGGAMGSCGCGTGAGTGAGMEGGGFLSDLGIPIISNLAGAVGLGRRRRAPAGPSDGRRKRAEVVKKVMAEKGLSMIEASKFVKAHNLY